MTNPKRDWHSERDPYTNYTRIMECFDELMDAMEETQPEDLTVVNRHDIGVYYNEHLKAEIIRLLRQK